MRSPETRQLSRWKPLAFLRLLSIPTGITEVSPPAKDVSINCHADVAYLLMVITLAFLSLWFAHPGGCIHWLASCRSSVTSLSRSYPSTWWA